ncbi:hypothetical protein LIER_31215 [Lithospermum erythrorhizon]|uniref:PB1-like domain-containing protein n=1 Tax=Lithospermum erythrorhizon TaxID=34254 RepID=A0AAV3RR97_LITER
MTWVIRKVRRLFIEDCVQVLCEVYDEFLTMKVHSLGEFKLYPTLVYEGGTTIDVDWSNLNLFDLKDVDEFSLRSGYDVDSRLFYTYKEPEMELICGLKPLLCDDDVVQFRELTSKRRCVEIYIQSSPAFELCRLYSRGMPMRGLDCDFPPLRVEGSYECSDSNSIYHLLCNEAYDISCKYPNFGYRENELC